MKQQIKKIFSDTAVYGFGNILNRLLSFLLLPLYTQYFSPEQFGVYSLIYAFWFFIVVLYLFGMETSFQKYFLEAENSQTKREIYTATLFFVLVNSVFFSTILFVFSESVSYYLTGSIDNSYLIKVLSVLLIVDSLSRFPMILLNSEQLSKFYTFLNVSSIIINIIFNIYFIVILKEGVESIFYSFIISYSYIIIISFFYCRKFLTISVDFTLLKRLLKFGHLFLYYGIFLISLDLVDRFVLEYFKGSEAVGLYSASYRIAMIMNLAISGFKVAWIPFFMKLKHSENNKEIFSKIFSYFIYVGLLLFLLMSFFANDIIKINLFDFTLINERYWSGMVILPYILLAYLFFGLYTNLMIASYFENKMHYLLLSSGIACIFNIILNIFLIPLFSITGAAVSTLISYGIMFIILYQLSQKKYYIPYEWKSISIIVMMCFLFYFADYFTEKYLFGLTDYFKFFFKTFLILIYVFVLYQFKFKNIRIS